MPLLLVGYKRETHLEDKPRLAYIGCAALRNRGVLVTMTSTRRQRLFPTHHGVCSDVGRTRQVHLARAGLLGRKV